MNAHRNPVVIWTENGCWYQQLERGLLRSSYLGHLGTPEEVREWCENSGVDFAKKFDEFCGTGIRERWPAA